LQIGGLVGGWLIGLNVLHWRFYLFQIPTALTYTIWGCHTIFLNKRKRWLWPRILTYLLVNAFVVMRMLEYMSNLWINAEEQLNVP
jgi:hypothetical protein